MTHILSIVLTFFVLGASVQASCGDAESAVSFASLAASHTSRALLDDPRRVDSCMEALDMWASTLVLRDWTGHDEIMEAAKSHDPRVFMTRILSHPSLRELRLESPRQWPGSKAWGRALADTLVTARIAELSWSRERVFDVSMREPITALLARGSLASLSLCGIGNRKRDAEAYSDFFSALTSSAGLRHISICESFLTRDSWENMCLALASKGSIERLEITTLEEIPHGVGALCHMIRWGAIRHMELIYPAAGVEGTRAIVEAVAASPHLESFHLDYVDICEDFPRLRRHFHNNFAKKKAAIQEEVRRRTIKRLLSQHPF